LKTVIVEIWKRSEQPCGKLLKATLPLWLESHERHHGPLPERLKNTIAVRCGPWEVDRPGWLEVPFHMEAAAAAASSCGASPSPTSTPAGPNWPGYGETAAARSVSACGGSKRGCPLCDRLLACAHVSEETERQLRIQRAEVDPLELSELIESKLRSIQAIVAEIEETRAEERWRAGEAAEERLPPAAAVGGGCVAALVGTGPGSF
jgi:hypothetical protein